MAVVGEAAGFLWRSPQVNRVAQTDNDIAYGRNGAAALVLLSPQQHFAQHFARLCSLRVSATSAPRHSLKRVASARISAPTRARNPSNYAKAASQKATGTTHNRVRTRY